MTDPQDSFTLRPMTKSDIPACAHLAGLSFESDRHTQLKALSPTNPYNHEEGMKQGLAYWLGSSPGSIETTVAIDNSTQEFLGWVAWGFRGFNSPEADAQLKEEIEKLSEDDASRPAEAGSENEHVENASSISASAREKLENQTGSDMTAWMKRLMPPGTKCMYICSIVVHPDHQGRGVGSALIREGTDRADKEGVFCWVHASEAGAPMFERCGFLEVGRLELDLDRWNTEAVIPPEGPDAKWGTYVFRYMRRDAKT